ncbi:MAG: prolyl oligopeptidase family serine peptidase [Fibrobacteria bacterium]
MAFSPRFRPRASILSTLYPLSALAGIGAAVFIASAHARSWATAPATFPVATGQQPMQAAKPAPSQPETGFRLDRFPPQSDTAAFDSAFLEPLSGYAQVRSAGFGGWADTGMYIVTQLGRFPQVHQVAAQGSDRRQLTFFPRRMSGFYLNPNPALANFLYTQDDGGNEQYRLRLYDLKTGLSRVLGCPPGRVDDLIWNDSGSRFAYSHTPAGTDRWDLRVGELSVEGGKDTLVLSLPGTWSAMEFSPDGRWLLVQRYVSASNSELHVLSLTDGWLTPLVTPSKEAFVDHAVWIRWPGGRPAAAAKMAGENGDIPWAVAYTSDQASQGAASQGAASQGAGAQGAGAQDAGAGDVTDGSSSEGFHRVYLARPQTHGPSGPAPGDAGPPPPEALSPMEPWDVEWIQAAPDRNSLVYSLNQDGLSSLYLLESGSKQPRRLQGIPPGVIGGIRFRPGTKTAGFAFTLNSAAAPGDVYVYDIAKSRSVRWTFSEAGGLPPGRFREAQLVRYPSGPTSTGSATAASVPSPAASAAPVAVPAWLFLPDPKVFPGPRPVLIQIHGGPEQQARPGFDAFLQYAVAELGLAVVQPNVRGSSGYGRAWLKADDGFQRMSSVRDIGALLDWIKTRPELDSSRVAVSGRSYGGFMSLSSLIEYGGGGSRDGGNGGTGGSSGSGARGRIRAGISTVGITHFPSFLQKTSGYRRDLRRAEYGDERNPRMAAFLDSISPLTRMDRIRAPLLLIHGRNDPRVPYSESERIFAALKGRKVPVWFLTFMEEGHAVRDQDGQIAQWRTMAEFLARNLGLRPR